MKSRISTLMLPVLLVAAQAGAQPDLDALWPNDDGLRFTYHYTYHDAMTEVSAASEAHLQLEGTTVTAGGEAQILLGDHGDIPAKALADQPALGGLLHALWRARPDLRPQLERLAAAKGDKARWLPLLLHDGYFMKGAEAIRMWQETWNHPTWTYLTSDLTPGASFVQQLIPEIVDDVFLHGTVGAVGVSVTTLAGTFGNALRMDYVIDLGTAQAIDENLNLICETHSEIRGHVHFVPGVGPVDMLEESLPFVTIDCGENDCPPEWVQWLGQVVEPQTLSLSDAPVPQTDASWGGVKSLYR